MPHKSGNSTSNMFYSTKGAETLRIAKANYNVNLSYSSTKPPIFRMIKEGAHNNKLSKCFKKLF